MAEKVSTSLIIGRSFRPFGRTPSQLKRLVKAQLAAQYPGIGGIVVVQSGIYKADERSKEKYVILTAEAEIPDWGDKAKVSEGAAEPAAAAPAEPAPTVTESVAVVSESAPVVVSESAATPS